MSRHEEQSVSERVREIWLLALEAPPFIIDAFVEEAEQLVASDPNDIDALDYLDALRRVQQAARNTALQEDEE